MENNWKKIHVGSNPVRIEILKQMLEENGVKSVILNKQDSSYRFGNIELYTHENDEKLALELISQINFEDDNDESERNED